MVAKPVQIGIFKKIGALKTAQSAPFGFIFCKNSDVLYTLYWHYN